MSLEGAVERLETAAQGRFVRWDGALWRDVVGGPATELARGLDDAGAGIGAAPLVESYLRLLCEAVGLGYLFPTGAGRESFFGLAFRHLAPSLLPRLPASRRAEVLAGLWNLGENLEVAPVWLARIFHRVARGWTTLEHLEEVVAEVERLALGPPAGKLGDPLRVEWVALETEDRRFLPGRMHFVTPTVLCVHDRARAGMSLGVWLTGDPLVLGPMGCRDAPGAGSTAGARWKRVAESDRRFDEPFGAVANSWRAAAAVVTSQRVVVLLPAQ